MGRKNLLEGLLTPVQPLDDSAPAATPRNLAPRTVRAVGAMEESLDAMAEDLRSARAKIEAGDVVVEIDTDLIDPSFVADRLGDDGELEELITSIRENGQSTPILVRPHPQAQGRYQIAFGHRRCRAARALRQPVRALVKVLNDDQVVIAQGQENQSRIDLSFIERAVFAARLATRFERDVICTALNIDKTEASRMIAVANAVPDKLIRAIGPSRSTGRRKWLELSKLIEHVDWKAEGERILDICQLASTVSSDGRFDLVLKDLSQQKLLPSSNKQSEGAPNFRVEKKPGVVWVRFDKTALTDNALDELLARIRDVCSSFGAKR